MKILLANKFYYRRGGDCIYVLNLERMLKEHGHEVAVFAMDYPQNLPSEWSSFFPSEMTRLKALTRPFGDNEVRKKFMSMLDSFRPDVVHLNNIHTHLSPVIAELAHCRGIRVVWTLHDYKLLCPRYDCRLGGKEICERCFGDDKTPCLRNTCMKGSMLASIIGWREAVTWNRKRLEACTDVFICPSRFMAEKMEEGGFDKEKLVPMCNFIDTDLCRGDDYVGRGDYYCFVGRLSHEKGVRTLVNAAGRLPYRLVVIGGGPLEEELRAIGDKNIDFVGFKQWDEIKRLVGGARFSVIPSEWYENNPLSVIEAQCLGTPVLGARIGGIPELIEEGVSGMTFKSGDAAELKEKIDAMFHTGFDYRSIAEKSQSRYDAGAYYEKLMTIYNG